MNIHEARSCNNCRIEYSFGSLFSAKAATIIKGFLTAALPEEDIEFAEMIVFRDENGEVKIGAAVHLRPLEKAIYKLGDLLYSAAKVPSVRNTVKARAHNDKLWNGIKMRDLSLLGLILNGADSHVLCGSFGEAGRKPSKR